MDSKYRKYKCPDVYLYVRVEESCGVEPVLLETRTDPEWRTLAQKNISL